MEELLRSKGLSEEVCKVLMRAHKGHDDLHVLDALANEEVPALHVFDAPSMLRVVGDRDGGFVVVKQIGWSVATDRRSCEKGGRGRFSRGQERKRERGKEKEC